LKAGDTFAMRSRAQYGTEGQWLTSAIQYHTYYALGDFEKLKNAALDDRTALGRNALLAAFVEQGQLDEAVKLLPTETESDEKPVLLLALSVAYRRAGNPTAANDWQMRAADALQNGNQDSALAAELLNKSALPTRTEVENVPISPQLKAVILAALAQRYPEGRAELAGLARKLNVERTFPFHLVQRVTTSAP